jgi:hypothetical protein
MGAMGCGQDYDVAKYARFAVALNLQTIARLVRQDWAFSIAADMATHLGTSYLDVRLRFCESFKIINVHLLAIPMHESHTGEAMYDTMSKCMAALSDSWLKRVIGISTDGARNMTGRFQGLATRLQRNALPGLTRVWCANHQLDILMQAFYKSVMSEEWYSLLTALVSWLRRQQSLITEMDSQAPLVSDTRWMNMVKVTA